MSKVNIPMGFVEPHPKAKEIGRVNGALYACQQALDKTRSIKEFSNSDYDCSPKLLTDEIERVSLDSKILITVGILNNIIDGLEDYKQALEYGYERIYGRWNGE